MKQGDIFWLDDCPPLDGDQAKRRPIVLLATPEEIADPNNHVLIVAVSTSVRDSEADRIELPSRETEPQTKTGLPKRCWVVPRWNLFVERERLVDHAGFISGAKLKAIFIAVNKRVHEQFPP